MTEDNRIRLPATLIDFANDVGVTGQDHDSYPAAGAQARYDHMRMYLIGLLSQQSSETAPTQYREGTPWLDTSTSPPILKIRSGDEWKQYSNAIIVGNDSDGDPLSLEDWYSSLSGFLSTFGPEITFSGTCTADDVTQIPIPETLRPAVSSIARPFVYINGLLQDPRDTPVQTAATPISIRLSGGVQLDSGDEFTVVIKSITAANFHSSTVTVP